MIVGPRGQVIVDLDADARHGDRWVEEVKDVVVNNNVLNVVIGRD